jgi:hypothetical protein
MASISSHFDRAVRYVKERLQTNKQASWDEVHDWIRTTSNGSLPTVEMEGAKCEMEESANQIKAGLEVPAEFEDREARTGADDEPLTDCSLAVTCSEFQYEAQNLDVPVVIVTSELDPWSKIKTFILILVNLL